MKKFLLLGAAVLGLSSMAYAQEWQAQVDGHTYDTDAETGVTCKNKWIIDRVHTSEKFLDLQFIKDYATKARTAVIDPAREKVYVGYSKTAVTTAEDGTESSNDYAHLVEFNLKTGEMEREIPLTVGTEIARNDSRIRA